MTDQNGTDLAELPDARIVIDLDQVDVDQWEAYDPNDGEGIVGTGETAPRAARDYVDQVIEVIERVTGANGRLRPSISRLEKYMECWLC